MSTVLIAFGALVFYLAAYHTYGRWVSKKLFNVDPEATTPATELEDGVDYVPTNKEVVFGHHFTSIAGTGPIVGPAIAVIWGWLPALIWVLVGSVFMGAVHDFGALIISLRHRGVSIADVTGSVIGKRARVLFMLVVFFTVLIVVAIFALVIALVFALYPQSVGPVWLQIPIAVALGLYIWHGRPTEKKIWIASILAVLAMYATIYVGSTHPVKLPDQVYGRPATFVWAIILFAYAFIASVLPVHRLLQPRDFINAHQLFIAMGLLVLGIVVAQPTLVAPAVNNIGETDATAPPFWPFLFITVACGAISGFHSLVGSGTSSKQLQNEDHARLVGFGSMLTEGYVAVLVIIAAAAGLGLHYDYKLSLTSADLGSNPQAAIGRMDQILGVETSTTVPSLASLPKEADGKFSPAQAAHDGQPDAVWQKTEGENGSVTYAATLEGETAWRTHYWSWKAAGGLGPKLRAFVDGAANMMAKAGIPLALGMAIMGVFVASFAGTTLDTATRLQRYVVSEFGRTVGLRWLENRYIATGIVVLTAGWLALRDGKGAGAMALWPLFGALNQLLATLALLVIAVYLYRRGRPIWVIVLPLIFMMAMTMWAMTSNISTFYGDKNWLLLVIGAIVLILQAWIMIEGVIVWLKIRRERATGTTSEA